MTSILNQTITAKTAPFLLCFGGLPCSSKSTALNTLMDHYLHKNVFDHNDKCAIRAFDFSAIRRPPANDIIYSSIDQLLKNGYILVVKSAIEYLLRVRGQFIKCLHDPSSVAADKVYFNDQEFDQHLITVFNGLSKLADLEKPKLKIPYWCQGIASGISLINIWDIGLNKVAFYILPQLAGLLRNSRSWLFFDIFRDLPNLYQPPYIPENKYDGTRNDSDCSMRWRARIHYLLRFAKLAQSCQTRENVCKLIGTYKTTNEDSNLADLIESFKKEVKCAATQMKVDNVIDMENVISYNPNDLNTATVFKELLDGIVRDEFSNAIEMPLSFVFLRSVLYATDAFCIEKNDLRLKAKKLKIEGHQFEDFCQLFTSFGSIIDVSLIDSSSDLVILKPVDFLRELDKLFYFSPNGDPLVTSYGIVTESTANFIFGREKTSTIMSFLTSIGFATKLSSLQTNFSISDQYAYYISNVCTARPILTCDPASLHLLRDVNIPMSNFQDIFATTFLSLYSLTTLEIPNDPHINITRFRAFPSNASNKEGVVFDLVYLGDAIEFRFPMHFNQGSSDHIDVCTQIITVCHKVMPSDSKYNFAVMCSDDPDPNAAYKLKRNCHILPNTKLCEICQDNGRLDNSILQTWNTVLSKVRDITIFILSICSFILIRMKIKCLKAKDLMEVE